MLDTEASLLHCEIRLQMPLTVLAVGGIVLMLTGCIIAQSPPL